MARGPSWTSRARSPWSPPAMPTVSTCGWPAEAACSCAAGACRSSGSVCMDMTMIDVTGADVAPGDEVVIVGEQDGESLGVREIAAAIGTIPYELLCRVGARIQRLRLTPFCNETGFMKPPRTVFCCQECGAQSAKWVGRCPDCGAWNSMVEERPVPETVVAGDIAKRYSLAGATGPQLYADIDTVIAERITTGIGEFDRVLGGGVVPGSLVLIGGEPGIGKSTLLLQAAAHFAKTVGPVLYSSGEESEHQIKSRGERLGVEPSTAPGSSRGSSGTSRRRSTSSRKPASSGSSRKSRGSSRRSSSSTRSRRCSRCASSRRRGASARSGRRPRSCCSRRKARTSPRSWSAT